MSEPQIVLHAGVLRVIVRDNYKGGTGCANPKIIFAFSGEEQQLDNPAAVLKVFQKVAKSEYSEEEVIWVEGKGVTVDSNKEENTRHKFVSIRGLGASRKRIISIGLKEFESFVEQFRGAVHIGKYSHLHGRAVQYIAELEGRVEELEKEVDLKDSVIAVLKA